MNPEIWTDFNTIEQMKKKETSLSERLSRLEGKVDFLVKLVFIQAGTTGSLLVALIIAVITFILSKGS